MEDFGGIIWMLIVIGFGIYGMTAQARKKKAEANQQHGHGEAWPSWLPETEEAEAAAKGSSHQQYSSMQPEFEDGTDAEPVYIEQMQAEPAFDDETRYSEVGSETCTGITPGKIARTVESIAADTNRAQTTAPHRAVNDAEAPEEVEFDLRKAVIYSEILKPKFEDENAL